MHTMLDTIFASILEAVVKLWLPQSIQARVYNRKSVQLP